MSEVLPNYSTAAAVEADVWIGSGREVVQQAAVSSGMDGSIVLRAVAEKLLVNKGWDWTVPILADYLDLYAGSIATFVLVQHRATGELIAHGALMQSGDFPGVGLIAHVRTSEKFRGRGVGRSVVNGLVQAGFQKGAQLIVLGTDDKIHRLREGEKAAHNFYSQIGFAVISETKLADTIDWLMGIDQHVFSGSGLRKETIESIHSRLQQPGTLQIQNVRPGDLAALVLLFNVLPLNDFKVKLSAWDIHRGPELERQFVVKLRPALGDRDRLEDASTLLREENGWIVAVCGATQEYPFTRHTFRMDFYCLPALLRERGEMVRNLITQTIHRISTSSTISPPLRLVFWGADQAKIELFTSLGFTSTLNRMSYRVPGGGGIELHEFVRILNA